MGSIQDEKPPPFHLTEVDRQILAQTDDEFVYHDWDELKDIIGESSYCRNTVYYIIIIVITITTTITLSNASPCSPQ